MVGLRDFPKKKHVAAGLGLHVAAGLGNDIREKEEKKQFSIYIFFRKGGIATTRISVHATNNGKCDPGPDFFKICSNQP